METGMEPILASNGQHVDEAMIDRWCDALDRDEWPAGEYSVGPVAHSQMIGLPVSTEATSSLRMLSATG